MRFLSAVRSSNAFSYVATAVSAVKASFSSFPFSPSTKIASDTAGVSNVVVSVTVSDYVSDSFVHDIRVVMVRIVNIIANILFNILFTSIYYLF